MLEFLLNSDTYFYILWLATWITISLINMTIYRSCVQDLEETLDSYWGRREFGTNVLLFFTFRWTHDEYDTREITRLKKILNFLSVFFAVLTIYCVGIWTYQFNQK